MKQHLSSLEFLLSVLSSLLLVCCVGLVVVSWISLKTEGTIEPVKLTGQMVITEGAEFSEELTNSSSLHFKMLAFDVQQLVSEAFRLSELRQLFRSCEVQHFSRGSVAVTFDLWFDQLIDVIEAGQQLGAGLQEVEDGGLVIDKKSIRITVSTANPDKTTTTATSVTPTAVTCHPHQTSCADQSMCVPINQLCDGVDDCPDASDESATRCATTCDGQFVLRGPRGSFSLSNNKSIFCRWIIRVARRLSVQVIFHHFVTEEGADTVRLYEGVGAHKQLSAEFSGSAPPGTVWLLTDQSTVEFSSGNGNGLSEFNATYSAANTSHLSNQQNVTCSFEDGICFWRQQLDHDGDWIRTSGATFPPSTGPSIDHTLGNSSGFYIVTPLSPGQWLKSFRIHSLPLTLPTQPMCLSFW